MAWSMHGKGSSARESPGDRWNHPPAFAAGQTVRINAHRAIELVQGAAEASGDDDGA